MPIYIVTHFYLDALNGTTQKQYEGDFVDYATARTAADALLVDAQALTDAHLFKETLAEVNDIAGAVAPSSNVFERINATVQLTGGDLYNWKIPSPIAGVFNGNALNTSATEWVNYVDNFTAASGWEISDGDHYGGITNKGRRVFVGSGKTNLPS